MGGANIHFWGEKPRLPPKFKRTNALVGTLCSIYLVILGRKAGTKQARKNRKLQAPLIYGGACIQIAGTSYIWRCLHFFIFWGFWAGLNLQIHPPSTYQSLPKYRHLQLVYNRFASCEHIYGDASVGACTCMCVSMCGHLRDSSCYAYCIRLSRALV